MPTSHCGSTLRKARQPSTRKERYEEGSGRCGIGEPGPLGLREEAGPGPLGLREEGWAWTPVSEGGGLGLDP
jgi:hypothetical protein